MNSDNPVPPESDPQQAQEQGIAAMQALFIQIAEAIAEAVDALKEEGYSDLSGFALGTDDDIRGVFAAACPREWLAAQGDQAHGLNFTEWPLLISEPFDGVSQTFQAIASHVYPSDEAWSNARFFRFTAMVTALAACKEEGIFEEGTFLCASSTDPSEDMQCLAMNAVDALNSKAIADRFAEAMDYGKYRNEESADSE